MKVYLYVFAFLVFVTGGVVWAESEDGKSEEQVDSTIKFRTVADIQDFSVTIHAGNAQGSGEIKTRDGVNYVFTAGHVISHLKTSRSIIDASGSTKTVVEFLDPKIVKELVEDGRSVGRIQMDAEVICYSDSEDGEDLALLRIRKKNFIKSSVQFYLDDKIPPVGTTLYHCGSLLGQFGSNSFTRGVMSQCGRVLYGKVYDQTTCAAFPGSSGGGVYLADGRMCGMVVRGAGETFNLIVPSRRIKEWAKKAGVEFAIDDKVPVPSEVELKKIRLDSTNNVSIVEKLKDYKEFKYLIYQPERKLGFDIE